MIFCSHYEGGDCMSAIKSVSRRARKREARPADDCDDRDPFSRQIKIDEILLLLDPKNRYITSTK